MLLPGELLLGDGEPVPGVPVTDGPPVPLDPPGPVLGIPEGAVVVVDARDRLGDVGLVTLLGPPHGGTSGPTVRLGATVDGVDGAVGVGVATPVATSGLLLAGTMPKPPRVIVVKAPTVTTVTANPAAMARPRRRCSPASLTCAASGSWARRAAS